MPEEQRFVLGIAYQAGPDPRIQRGVDGGRDYFTKTELEKACWSYMRSGAPQMNAFHVDGTEDCAEPVESFIWRWPDWDTGDGVVVKDGDWCLGAILSPRMWSLYKDGKVNGLSPEGTARRRRVAKEGAVAIVAIAKGSAVSDDNEDELTELTDASFKKVALVGSGANGIPRFLIAKEGEAAGLVDADTVRDLIAKSPQEAPVPDAEAGRTVLPNGITLSGSPAAVAAFIHKAAVASRERDDSAGEVAKAAAEYEAVTKAKYNAADRKKMAASGAAMPDGSYPIGDADDLDKAIHAVGRGGAGHNAIRKHVITRAKSLGKSSMIPGNWNSDGSLKSGVSKEAGMPDQVAKDAGDALDAAVDDGQDSLDPTVPAAAPDGLDDIPGDPTDPGSPAWEAVDAATAVKWSTILAAGKRAVCWLQERELLEAATVDPDDAENACDLASVLDALDYAIGVLAPYAVSEQSEADGGALEMVGKSAEPPSVAAAMVAIAKAGRVLSSANESKIRSAAQALNDVLASLPQAPDAGGTAAVTKEGAMPQTETAPVAKDTPPAPAPAEAQAADKGPEPQPGTTTGLGQPRDGAPQASLPGDVPGRTVIKSALPVAIWDHTGQLLGVTAADAIVMKADGDKQMMAVFDAQGNLVGVVDPTKVQAVAGAGKKPEPEAKPDDGAKPDDDGTAPAPAPAADAPVPQPGPAADTEDLEPQPSPDAGIPADDVAKSGGAHQNDAATVTQDVVKAVTEQVAKALESSQAAHAEVVAKMAADNAGLAETVEALKARLETVENTPAMPKVALNGAVPPAQLRGQDQGEGAREVDVTKARERKAELYAASGPDQARIAKEMQGDAVAYLEALHAGR